MLKAQQLREARERSINRSREVTERVKLQKEKEELEAKKNEEAKKRTISESKGRLRWVNNEKARSISKQVKLKGLTNTPMAFFNAIDKGKRTKWSGKPIILAWLIHEMLFLNPPPIKCEVTKGAYKAATELFDYGQSSDSKDRLSEKASRVFSAGEQNYLEIRELVNRILKLNGE
ncbi:MAG: hypothetical protein M0D57_04505 [Sphingobacteriales bacterium JAD_PAG50586_3]|nr:MAG: hypothetical protein M0D57_04505 [Sphingobacteriales bacterium JAD_PAG50586_3]